MDSKFGDFLEIFRQYLEIYIEPFFENFSKNVEGKVGDIVI